MHAGLQVEVGRCARVDLVAVTNGAANGTTGAANLTASSTVAEVFLSPQLATESLPALIDTVKTLWPMNPYGPLPPKETRVGGVLEFSLRDSGTWLLGTWRVSRWVA